MTTELSTRASSLSGPGIDYPPVTPEDSALFAAKVASLYVETGGAVRFAVPGGEIRTVTVPDHGWIRCSVTGVEATGTTASGIHAIMVG